MEQAHPPVSSKHITRMTIDDALHMDAAQRAAIIGSYKPHELEARTKGIPALGSGRVFPVTEESITVKPFDLPYHWARIGGMDFGWDHPHAAVDCAWDRDDDVFYVTKAYMKSEAPPLQHAMSLRPWGGMPWAWPSDGYAKKAANDGAQLKTDFEKYGMRMLQTHAQFPDKSRSVEAGVIQIYQAMLTGKFKVFANLLDWFEEFRMYHRKDGEIVKRRDDLMDATRYAWMMRRFAEPPQIYEIELQRLAEAGPEQRSGRSEETGY